MGIEIVRNDFSKTMEGMLSKAKSFQGGAARIYKMYQRFQVERFTTEGGSEGEKWQSLSPTYAQYKKSRYGGGPKRGGGNWKSWPGAGTKMLIGTGTLAGAVIGPGSPFSSAGTDKHRALFTSTSMEISVEQSGDNAEGRAFDYASDVDEVRPLMEFSDDHLDQMKDELMKFVIGE